MEGVSSWQTSKNRLRDLLRRPFSAACFLLLLMMLPVSSFAQTPSLTGFSPVSAAGIGFELIIGGSNFGATQGSSTIKFNGVAATADYWSDTQIMASVPAGATTGPVTVTVGGVASNGLTFTITTTPLLTGFSPGASGGVGTQIIIGGSNFGATQGSSTITFNGVSAGAAPYWSNNQVYANVPAGAATGPVVVTVGGVASNGLTFTVVSTPQISGLSPVSAAGVGFPLIIGGSNFGATQGSSTITFNGVPAPATYWSNTVVCANVPAGATTGPVVVTVGGVASNALTFTVTTTPLLTGFSPGASGGVGTQIIIGGSNFGATQGSSTITFNGVSAGVAPYWSNNQVSANVPAGATTGPVVVTVGGIPSNGLTFTVLPPPVIAVSASPTPNASGWNNSNVTVTFACTPATNGPAIASCTAPQTVSTQGANQVISGTATDTAGVTASVSATVNLDLTAPQLAISAPANGTRVSSSALTVTGAAADTLSGISAVTCNGVQATLSGSDFSCSLTLSSAQTPVVVTATDLAGNATSSSVNVTLTVPGASTPTGSMSSPRQAHTATVLTNGFGLIAGGVDGHFTEQATTILYNPITATFTGTGSMTTPRVSFTATLLNNGMVLMAGGSDAIGNPIPGAELYDPISAVFTVTGNMSTARASHTATVLNDGTVLITGGFDSNFNTLASAELYNPATKTFTGVGSLATGRVSHTATLLNNGQVLVVGGNDANGNALASAELYDPASRTFTVTTGGLSTARGFHTATLLNSGKVLVVGGVFGGFNSTATAELFDPTTATFTATGSMSVPRVNHAATLLTNGTVFVSGGQDLNGSVYFTTELFDPVAESFSTAANMNQIRSNHSATLLTNGTLLLVGGQGSDGFVLASTELYDPSTLTPPSLVSVAVTPATPSILAGAAQQFTATGTFSDGSTQVLSSATWSSSDNTIATMTNDSTNHGHAFGIAAGSVAVKACAGAASPDSFTTANVSGTFADGASLNGTVTIDTTIGTITGASLTTTGGMAGTFTFANYLPGMSGPDGPNGFAANFSNGSVSLSLVLFTATAPDGINGTLVNFNGSSLCVGQDGCGDPTEMYTADAADLLATGAVTSTPGTPNCASVNMTVAAAGLDITGLTPVSGPVSAPVIIAGTGFGATQGTSTVTFNGVAASIGLWSDTAIVTSVPIGATTGSVVVTVSGVNSNGFVFTVGTGPVITALSPFIGSAGNSVTIVGSNFGMTQGASTVTFNGIPATSSSWSNTSIVALVPANATTGNVVVTVSGVASNGARFTVPSITGVSPSSGAIGELITILGTGGFGATQGSGTVSINNTAMSVLSWSDVQILARVATGTTTGPVVVHQGLLTLTGPIFSVTTNFPYLVSPQTINMLVGQTRTISVTNGAPVTGLHWITTDPTIVSLSNDDPPILTALAVGSVTVYAGVVPVSVTVNAGTSLPPGTPIWSLPLGGSTPLNIVPAVPSDSSVDVFTFDDSGTLSAISADGSVVWKAGVGGTPSSVKIIPDFSGSAILKTPFTFFDSQDNFHSTHRVQQVNASTGQLTTLYTFSDQFANLSSYSDNMITQAVVPDTTGMLFIQDGPTVLLMNPNTSQTIATFSVSGSTGSLIVAGDGNAYLPYVASTETGDFRGFQDETVHTDFKLNALRMSPDGTSANTQLSTTASDSNCVPWVPPGVSRDSLIDGFQCVASGYSFILPSVITNAGAGAAVFVTKNQQQCATTLFAEYFQDNPDGTVQVIKIDQQSGCPDLNQHYQLTDVSNDSVVSQIDDAFVLPDDGAPVFVPALQRADGSYVGTDSRNNVILVGSGGGIVWRQQIGSDFIPVSLLYATADGGVVTTTQNGQMGTLFTLDQNGSITSQTADTGAVYSWTGNWYSDPPGSISNVSLPALAFASSYWAYAGANPSTNGAAVIQETLYVRSFAPWPMFGRYPLGIGCSSECFQGDNRTFSTSITSSVTSRINGIVTFVLPNFKLINARAYSDPSFDLFGRTAISNPSITASADQGVFHVSYAGSNPLVPGSPDIDVHLDMTGQISSGQACYSGHLFGDAFPNTEVFIINSQKTATMLHTFQTIGDPTLGPEVFLPGDLKRDMGSFSTVCTHK